MRQTAITTMLAIGLLTGCQSETVSENADTISYDVIGKSGETIGGLTLTEKANGVHLKVKLSGISPGEHGIHLHHTGSCITPDFKSAGGHINPMKKAHGLNNPDGPDNADMPNAIANDEGNVVYEYLNERVSLRGAPHRPALLDENGSALVMHQNPDDGITQPIGGAGPRIACAQIN